MSKHLFALITAAGFLAACTDSDDPATEPPPPDPVVERVEIDGPFELTAGDELQFTAQAFDADDQPIAGRSFAWQSDTPDVATVDASGRVTALTAGEATIYATTGDVTGGLFLTVVEGELPFVAYVEIAPAGEIDLFAGETLQLVATAHAADGTVLTGRELTWQTQDAAVATVSDDGVVTAIAAGSTGIRVLCESQHADLTVRVPDATASFALTAVGSIGVPAQLGAFTTTNDSTTVLSQVQLRDGALTIDFTARTYEVELHGLVSSQVLPSFIPVPITYTSAGTVENDAATGEWTFTPVDGDPFIGRWVTTGMQLVWRPDDRIPAASTLLFTE